MLDAQVAAVRHFSRFYTRRIGVLEDSLLGSGLTLPQGRLVFEVAQVPAGNATPGLLASALGLDAGYVSRLVAGLDERGLLQRQASRTDGRSVSLQLTAEGRRVYAAMDERSHDEVARLIARLPESDRIAMTRAMRTIEALLDSGSESPARPTATIRSLRPGDMGWVVHRHGVLYNAEYGWDWTFEGLVAEVASEIVAHFDPARDCGRIAEVGGEIVGSAFVVHTDRSELAKLRLVYVEPGQRGTGLGRRLVEDCMTFARGAGYTRMTLWTNDVLVAARSLYERLGFVMTAAEPVEAFGRSMVSEIWERDL
ncbi:MAG: GNAT family N-acetyltransferase [Hyphomicrobiaceae bacterium]